MHAAARTRSKGFFKCSSGRLFMGGYFFIIIITKLIALQGFNLRDSKGNERSIALLMIPSVLFVLDGGTKLRDTVLDRPITNHSNSG